MAENSKKLLIVYISEVLHKFSDRNHKLTQGEIGTLVKKLYNLDVERKAVARNIEALQNSGIDIGSDGGYYLKSRDVNEADALGIFIALGSSHLISTSSANEILDGITKKNSSYFKENLHDILMEREKPRGLQLGDVLAILQSIREKKKLSFLCPPYLVHGKHISKSGKYVITPRTVFFENGELILAGLNPNRGACGFNMLGISDLEITPSRQKNEEDMSTQELLEQIQKPIPLVTEATFKVNSEAMILFVREFGTKLSATTENGGKTFTVRVSASRTTLKELALVGGAQVTLSAPMDLQDELVEEIIDMAGVYS